MTSRSAAHPRRRARTPSKNRMAIEGPGSGRCPDVPGRRHEQARSMTTFELRDHLFTLNAERASAALHGLDGNGRYLADLQTEIDATRHAFVGAAVTEIASLRAQLGAPLLG